MISKITPFLFALFLLTAPVQSLAQVVSGTVTDKDSGEILEAAGVFFESTFQGTVTNKEGRFELSIPYAPIVLHIRYIGYETERISIGELESIELDVKLSPSVIQTEEIVFTGEDPAVRIMQRVIEEKQRWRKQLESFSANAYTRQVLSNEDEIASISETETKLFWQKDIGYREIILAQSQTANLSFDQNFAGATNLPNFYDDEITISGYRLIGPTHPQAFRYYEFRYEGQRNLDGKLVFDISLHPRRPLQPLFEGRIAILDEYFAMIEAELRPNETVRFPPPISRFDVDYRQQFNNFGTDFWLPVDARLEGMIEIGLPGLRFPPFVFQQLTRITDYNLEPEIPDSLLASNRRLYFDRERLRATEITANQRAIPLTERETIAYQNVDSTQTLDRVFQPSGPLARAARLDNNSSSFSYPGSEYFRPQVYYNRVDAFTAGIDIRYEEIQNTNLELLTLYSFGQNKPFFDVRLGYQIRRSNLELRFAQRSDVVAESPLYGATLNSLGMLLGAEDYFDYFNNSSALLSWIGPRFFRIQPQIAFSIQEHTSLDRVTNYSLIGDITQPDNPDIEDGRLNNLRLGLRYGNPPSGLGFSHNNAVSFDVEIANPELLGGEMEYIRAELRADWRIPTFVSRRLFPNTLDLRFRIVTSTPETPVQRSAMLDNSYFGYAPFGSFATSFGRPDYGRHLGVFYWEHNFQTLPFELLGINYLADKGIGLIVHGASGFVHSEDDFLQPIPEGAVWHEAGLSVNRLFGIARIGLSRNLSEQKWVASFAVARYF